MKNLDELIDLVKNIETIPWGGGDVIDKTEDGKDILEWPYPIYPDGLCESLYHLIELDKNYLDNYEKLKDSPDYQNLTKEELSTVMTHYVRGERFCDGLIAEAIEDGTLLKVLMRIKEVYPDL